MATHGGYAFPEPGGFEPAPKSIGRRLAVMFAFLLVLVGFVFGGARVLVSLTSESEAEELRPSAKAQADSAPRTPPLDFSGFSPGNIISDERLHDTSTMSVADIDAFIKEWNAGCVPGRDGTPCLQDWRGSLPSFAEDDSCWAVTGGDNLTAAEVIYQVSQACEMNPQAIIVILQKEQGLITASGRNLKPWRYETAMGFGCPDHGECAEEYKGFGRQVYYGARQFQKYRIYPERYEFQPGVTEKVPFSPNPECGSSEVFLENQATASLYNYTPHQPNADALAGEEGGCSSWGNLHFYAYWKAWFAEN